LPPRLSVRPAGAGAVACAGADRLEPFARTRGEARLRAVPRARGAGGVAGPAALQQPGGDPARRRFAVRGDRAPDAAAVAWLCRRARAAGQVPGAARPRLRGLARPARPDARAGGMARGRPRAAADPPVRIALELWPGALPGAEQRREPPGDR